MSRNLLPVLSLLLGALFLLAGNGLHGLLLPLRGTAEGFSPATLGLLGTSWASGFVLGCIFAPRVVRRVGHVRAFSAFCAMTAIIALLTGLFVDSIAWILLRAVTGFSVAAAFMIIESWLNERATNESRGQIFSLYMMINYTGIVLGQMAVAFGDIMAAGFFMITGILYCLALLPTAVSTAGSPMPLKDVKLDLKSLYRNSPISFVGILLVGIANGCFGTLAAVFGTRMDMTQTTVALMMSLTLFAGALAQWPAGRLSDRIDRRYVLVGLAVLASLAGLLLFAFSPDDIILLFSIIAVYGAASYTLYSIIVAHANDFASQEDFVRISGGLLLLYGVGTIIGPMIGGLAMDMFGPHALFAVTVFAHVMLSVYALVRIHVRSALAPETREAFQSLPSSRLATPESFNLAPKQGTADKP